MDTLPLRAALRLATPIGFPRAWREELLLPGAADDLFRRAAADGLDALAPSERRGHLPVVIGAVAEAVAARALDEAGCRLFSQLIETGARGADLLFLTPAERVLVIEVKGTLRPGSLPRMPRSKRKQMSAPWLDSGNAPMLEWQLTAADVYGAVMVVDLVDAALRLAVTADYEGFAPASRLDHLDEALSALG